MTRQFQVLTIGELGIFQRVVHLLLERNGLPVTAIRSAEFLSLKPPTQHADIVCLFNRQWQPGEMRQAELIRDIFPGIPVVNIGLENGFTDILHAIRAGCRGYFPVTIAEEAFIGALDRIINSSAYYFDLEHERCIYSRTADLDNPDRITTARNLPPHLQQLLSLLCTEMDYPEIAACMQVKPVMLDRYRQDLSRRLQLKSRVGLCLFAIYNGLDVAG